MRRLTLWLIAWLCFAAPAFALDGVAGVNNPAKVNGVATPDKVSGVSGLAVAAGGATCVGWPSSGCVPTGVPTSSGMWTAPDDRTYCRQETATASGTAIEVIAYLSSVGTGNTIWGVVYADVAGTWTLIGYGSAVSPVVGYNTITLTSGTRAITNGTAYRFGVAHSPASGTTGVGREDTGGSGLYSNTGNVDSAPLSTATFTLTADRDMALILKIE